MSNVIGIVNYGVAGNIYSIEKAIKKAGGKALIIKSEKDFKSVDKVVIPGVGSFKEAMQELEKDGFIDILYQYSKLDYDNFDNEISGYDSLSHWLALATTPPLYSLLKF